MIQFWTYSPTPRKKTPKYLIALFIVAAICYSIMFLALPVYSIFDPSARGGAVISLAVFFVFLLVFLMLYKMNNSRVIVDEDTCIVEDCIFFWKRVKTIPISEISSARVFYGYHRERYIVFYDKNRKRLFQVWLCEETEKWFSKIVTIDKD